MKKFTILFDRGLWDHAIIGFDDGSYTIIPPEKKHDSQWLSENVDESMKVCFGKGPNPLYGATTYNATGLSRAPIPTLKEFKAFRVGDNSFDIKFLADYISEDRTWFVVHEKPDIMPSIYDI